MSAADQPDGGCRSSAADADAMGAVAVAHKRHCRIRNYLVLRNNSNLTNLF